MVFRGQGLEVARLENLLIEPDLRSVCDPAVPGPGLFSLSTGSGLWLLGFDR